MTNMIPFDPNQSINTLPAHLQGASLSVSQGLLAVAGESGNRIGLKGSRFRMIVAGKEEHVVEQNYIDVHVLGVVPYYSRSFYEGAYKEGENAAPACYSETGKTPADDAKKKQHSVCETCPQNQKGSKIVDGVKMKACSYFQRLIVGIVGDDSGMVYKLDVKSQGLFGDSQTASNKFNLRDYAKYTSNRGVDVGLLVTRISFDTNASVPKLLFHPVGYVTEQDVEKIKAAVASEEVKALLKISMATIDLSNEAKADEEMHETPQATAEIVKAAPVETKAAPVVAATPAPPAAPTKYLPCKEKLGEFTVQQMMDTGWTKEALLAEGYITVYVEPAPAVPPKPPAPPAPPAPPKPPAPPAAAVQIENVPPPVKATPKAPAPPAAQPAKSVTVQETTTDAELEDIIGQLV